MKVEQVVGVPLHVALELHWQLGLVAHELLDVKVLHAVGVPVQVPPEDHSQLPEAPHSALLANVVQAFGVPVQAEVFASQTQPGKTPQVSSSADASAHTNVPVCSQAPAALENLHPGSKLHVASVPSLSWVQE